MSKIELLEKFNEICRKCERCSMENCFNCSIDKERQDNFEDLNQIYPK